MVQVSGQALRGPKRSRKWMSKKGGRVESLPAAFAIVGVFMVGLLAVSPKSASLWKRPEVALDRGDALAVSSVAAVGGLGAAADRRRLMVVETPFPSVGTINLSSITCPAPTNSSSFFTPLPFEETAPAGAFIFMVVITLWMFLGLAIVCDSFFETALGAICEKQGLKDDVAGATWMAAGGSAPELATSVIGLFLAKSDVGFGTIVGSAVFNVLFVIGCCTFVAPNLKLTWWPLARDASYYCFSLAMLVIFVSDLRVEGYEAVILLLMYVGYVTIMYFNEKLEVWVKHRGELNEKPGGCLQSTLKALVENPIFVFALYVIIVTNAVTVILEMDEYNQATVKLPCMCDTNIGAEKLPLTPLYWVNLGFNIFFIVEMLVKFYAYGFFGYWKIPLNAFDGALVFLIVVELILIEAARANEDTSDMIGVEVARSLRLVKFIRFFRTVRMLRIGGKLAGSAVKTAPSEIDGDTEARTRTATTPPNEAEAGEVKPVEKDAPTEDAEDDEDDDDDEPFNPFEPWGDLSSFGGICARFFYIVGFPLCLAFYLTIPDCRREMFSGGFWYLGTFFGCIFWIGTLSVFMVWMVERLGDILGISPEIMGLVILAAGTSIPDCLSSVAVARRGHGDMAVSSSIGSNIFDVLIGLPVPWFLQTIIFTFAVPEPGVPDALRQFPPYVPINSEGLAVLILMLFVMVALVVTTVHISGWVLSLRLGISMMALYFVFLIFSLMLILPLVTDPDDPIPYNREPRAIIFPACKIVDELMIGG